MFLWLWSTVDVNMSWSLIIDLFQTNRLTVNSPSWCLQYIQSSRVPLAPPCGSDYPLREKPGGCCVCIRWLYRQRLYTCIVIKACDALLYHTVSYYPVLSSILSTTCQRLSCCNSTVKEEEEWLDCTILLQAEGGCSQEPPSSVPQRTESFPTCSNLWTGQRGLCQPAARRLDGVSLSEEQWVC